MGEKKRKGSSVLWDLSSLVLPGALLADAPRPGILVGDTDPSPQTPAQPPQGLRRAAGGSSPRGLGRKGLMCSALWIWLGL